MKKEPNSKHYTRGGQTSFHNLRMWDQITKNVVLICLFVWGVLTGLLIWMMIPYEKIQHAGVYYYANLLKDLHQKHIFSLSFHGQQYRQSIDMILYYPYYRQTAKFVIDTCAHAALYAFFTSLIAGGALALYFIRRGKLQTQNQFIRGSQLTESNIVKRKVIHQRMNSDITIDGFPLIKDSEVQHMLVHGTVGKGKSQYIMKIMDALRERGDRVIVYDKGCTFIESYFHEKIDRILNPFDARCANWDLWREAPTDPILENMSESWIPMQGENDPFWVNGSRTVFSSTAGRMRYDKDRSLDKLWRILIAGEIEELALYLRGTAAATLVSNKIEKTAISIRAVLTTYLKSMHPLIGLNSSSAEPFSIRDYILNPDEKGWLFISSNGDQHKALKPLISMWIAMASMTLLSLPEDAKRRIWFICDELPSLHKLPMLGETIAEVRKFGGCFLLGMQSHAQLEKVYGRSGASEIFDLLNTRAFFASPSHQMAQLVSKELGDEEVDDTRENYSYGANSIRDGISVGKNRITRPIVTSPEIMNLDALTCYLRLPGEYPVTKLKLKYEKRLKKAEGYIQRKGIFVPEFNTSNANISFLDESQSSFGNSPQEMSGARKSMSFDPLEYESDSII